MVFCAEDGKDALGSIFALADELVADLSDSKLLLADELSPCVGVLPGLKVRA